MQAIRKSNKRVIVSVVMALMMALAMMPGMAFAQSVVAGYDVDITGPATVKAGTSTSMTADITAPEGETAHIDWSIVEGDGTTAEATLNKHQGELTATTEGVVTVKANLRQGAAQSGSGSGQGQECVSQTLVATDTFQVTVEPAVAYGYQGEGGNTMLMEQIAGADVETGDITVGTMGTYNSKNCYKNTITDAVTSTNVTVQNLEDDLVTTSQMTGVTFGYTMSAGINNFKVDTFKTYMDDIKVYNANGTAEVTGIEYVGFNNRIVTIAVDASKLTAGAKYILRFGPSVCGNNVDKKLDCYVDFTFTYGGAAQ